MKIETGKGYITLWALVGVWSISALTSLPGLAVSPILGDLSSIFKTATEFDIQMLTSLPSLLIIPFILLSGRLSAGVGYLRLLVTGLVLFLVCGVLYLLCSTITQLIVVSVLLGVGAGIITPLSTSLITRFFTGEYRTRQFGYSSAINNLSLVAATAITGYLAEVQWRLPFLVYLLPIVSLFLVGNIKSAEVTSPTAPDGVKQGGALPTKGIDYPPLIRLMLYYLLITFMVMAISVNLPFLMAGHGYSSGTSGLVISLFFLFIMLPGLFLNKIVAFLRGREFIVCLLLISCGLSIIFFSYHVALITFGAFLAGIGYGIAQPCIYDRTASVASAGSATYAMALVMTMNYVAIVICPPVVDYLQKLFAVKSAGFAFALDACIGLVAVVVLAVWNMNKRR